MNTMKKALVVILIIAGLAVWGAWVANRPNVYDNDEVGIKFEYPDGYNLTKQDLEGESFAIILMDEGFVPVEGGEGPPVIVVNIHENGSGQSIEDWAKNDPYSNLALAFETYHETEVAGQPAISYLADGLYANDNVVLRHEDHIIHLYGAFIDSEDEIRQDFRKVLDTLELY